MWNNATKIGCGSAKCNDTTVVSCNYGTDNEQGGAGNLNPTTGKTFSDSKVPINCNIDPNRDCNHTDNTI